jgi:hypothetical protein
MLEYVNTNTFQDIIIDRSFSFDDKGDINSDIIGITKSIINNGSIKYMGYY